ncbi:hypothetical protein [Salinicoccus sp. CNSTN-B1]
MANLSPKIFGDHFSEGNFEAIYNQTAAAFQNQMSIWTLSSLQPMISRTAGNSH